MSPVEPSPVVIGTIGLPSTEGSADFIFLVDIPSAFSLMGANRLPAAAPRVDKKERRFQPDFKFIRSSVFDIFRINLLASRGSGGSSRRDHYGAADDFNQRIPWNPLQCHAGAGRRFPWAEVGPIDFVQCVVLRLMRVEPRFARRHRDAIGERQAQKDLEIDNAVHRTTCSLDRSFQRIHRASDVFLEGICYKNMVVLGVAVIGTGSGEVINTAMRVVASSRAARP